jgi:serine/threonine protein kinase
LAFFPCVLTSIPFLSKVCGTPDYVAPEILKHQMSDYKGDVWSAGVIGYILLGGYAPFQARNPDGN